MPEVTIPLTVLSELLISWKGRRSTRERLIVLVAAQNPELSDAAIGALCGIPEEHVRWLKGDISGATLVTDRSHQPRNRNSDPHWPRPTGYKSGDPPLAA